MTSKDDPNLMSQIARQHGLSKGIGNVLRLLRWLPLASANDIADVPKRPRPRTGVLQDQDLGKLKGQGLVESAELGCTRGQRQR